MQFNPAQQIAFTILTEFSNLIGRAIVQKGAMAFADANYYQRWRDKGDAYISDRLTKIYGSMALDKESNNYWLWHLLPEHANLCHNMPYYSISLMRMQNDQPTDLLIMQPGDTNFISAAIGSGCFTPQGRARVSKQREASSTILVAGESLPGARRSFGSPLLEIAMVATGNLDAGYWNQLGKFLCFAARLLLSESGGMSTNISGKQIKPEIAADSLLVANTELHPRLLALIQADLLS